MKRGEFNLYTISMVIILTMFILPSISAQQPYKQSTDVNIKIPCFNNNTYCSASAVCNVTILAPDGSTIVYNQLMTNQLTYHNYTIISNYTSQLGFYQSSMVCQDGGRSGSYTFEFQVTGNGKDPPSGIVIVLFSLLFLIIIGFMVYSVVHTTGHFIKRDFDILDLAMNWGLYFALLALFTLEGFYLGNPDIHSWFLWLIYVTGITHIFLPAIAFGFSFITNLLKVRRSND